LELPQGDFIKINRSNTAKGMAPNGHSPIARLDTDTTSEICKYHPKDGVTLKAGMENGI